MSFRRRIFTHALVITSLLNSNFVALAHGPKKKLTVVESLPSLDGDDYTPKKDAALFAAIVGLGRLTSAVASNFFVFKEHGRTQRKIEKSPREDRLNWINYLSLSPVNVGVSAFMALGAAGFLNIRKNDKKLRSIDYTRYIKSQGKETKNEELKTAVNEILQNLVSQAKEIYTDAHEFDWQLTVIDSPTKNAFCLPGGKMVIYTGMIKTLQTSDAIAGVIGHEMGHALAHHSTKALSLFFSTFFAIKLLTNFEELRIETMIITFAGWLIHLSQSRQNEFEADKIGFVLTAKAGYNPEAIKEFWQKDLFSGEDPEFLCTHPHDKNCADALAEIMDEVKDLYEEANKQPTIDFLPLLKTEQKP